MSIASSESPGALPGDKLILSKALGTGVITTALKRGIAKAPHLEGAIASMSRLNDNSARLAQQFGVHAMTDITGFGLAGHGQEMARLSQVDLALDFARLHWLPGAMEYAEAGVISPVAWRATVIAFRNGLHLSEHPPVITNLCCTILRLREAC